MKRLDPTTERSRDAHITRKCVLSCEVFIDIRSGLYNSCLCCTSPLLVDIKDMPLHWECPSHIALQAILNWPSLDSPWQDFFYIIVTGWLYEKLELSQCTVKMTIPNSSTDKLTWNIAIATKLMMCLLQTALNMKCWGFTLPVKWHASKLHDRIMHTTRFTQTYS